MKKGIVFPAYELLSPAMSVKFPEPEVLPEPIFNPSIDPDIIVPAGTGNPLLYAIPITI